MTTKEGVDARVTVQARWAISRKSLLATWSALPQRPGEELVAPVLFAAFRTAAPRYEVLRLIAESRTCPSTGSAHETQPLPTMRAGE